MRDAVVFAALLSLPAEAALANAWLKEKGQGEVISSTTVVRQQSGLSGGVAAQGFSALHVEYGALENASLIADAGYTQYASQGTTNTLFDTAFGGSRFIINRWDNSVLSAELLGGVSGIRENFLPGSPIAMHGTSAFRLAFGNGFDFLGRHAFAGVEAGYRWRPGPPADELQLDWTVGIEPWSTGLLMLQSFAISGLGPAHGAYRRYDLVKFQLSLAQKLSERWWIQLGAVVTAAGVDSGNAGGTVALWRRF